jgi:hypothetical protein
MKAMDHDMLGVRWKKRPMTASEYLAFSKTLVHKLMEFDPLLKGLIVWGKKPNQKPHIAKDLRDFDDMVLAYLDDSKNWLYDNPDPNNRKLTLDSTCPVGFRISYSDKETYGDLTIDCGKSVWQTNVINIGFPGACHPKCQDYSYVSALMKLMVEYCKPDNAFMTYGRHGKELGQQRKEAKLEYDPGLRSGRKATHPIGWLNYFADPSVKHRLPDDIETEVLATGGTLITLKRSLPSTDNEEDVATAKRIRDALMQPVVVDAYWQANQGSSQERTE